MAAEGAENDNKMVIGVTEKIEVKVAKADSNTVLLVVVLVMGVGLIFICFALVAICYRCPSLRRPAPAFVSCCVYVERPHLWCT